MKYLLLLTTLVMTAAQVNAYPFDYKYYDHWKAVYHPHNESSYQHAWCSLHKGIEEYENPDKTRVDCLTDTHAVEFDFANKIYEALGQSLHYGIMTGKRPKIVLILDRKYFNEQMRYFERVKRIGKAYNIDVEYVSDDILNLDKKGRCPYSDCKCNRRPQGWLNKACGGVKMRIKNILSKFEL